MNDSKWVFPLSGDSVGAKLRRTVIHTDNYDNPTENKSVILLIFSLPLHLFWYLSRANSTDDNSPLNPNIYTDSLSQYASPFIFTSPSSVAILVIIFFDLHRTSFFQLGCLPFSFHFFFSSSRSFHLLPAMLYVTVYVSPSLPPLSTVNPFAYPSQRQCVCLRRRRFMRRDEEAKEGFFVDVNGREWLCRSKAVWRHEMRRRRNHAWLIGKRGMADFWG